MISLSHEFDIPNAPSKCSQLKAGLQMINSNRFDKAINIAKIYIKKRNEDGNYYAKGERYSYLTILH